MMCRACLFDDDYIGRREYVMGPETRPFFIRLAPLSLVGDDGIVQRQTVPIAACPKCGTIRLVSADGS